MNAYAASVSRAARPPALAGLLVTLLALALPAHAGVTTVYKCFDRQLGVLYTDQPCRGEQLNIEGGSIDPVAIAELQREREAVARSAALRVADNRRAALDRDLAASYMYAGPPPVANYGNDIYWPAGGYGYYPDYNIQRSRPDRPDRFPPQARRTPPTVPAPPGNLIKR